MEMHLAKNVGGWGAGGIGTKIFFRSPHRAATTLKYDMEL